EARRQRHRGLGVHFGLQPHDQLLRSMPISNTCSPRMSTPLRPGPALAWRLANRTDGSEPNPERVARWPCAVATEQLGMFCGRLWKTRAAAPRWELRRRIGDVGFAGQVVGQPGGGGLDAAERLPAVAQ